MQRLICSLLLTLASLTTMAQSEYPIHEDFRSACRITAPLGRGVLGIGNAFLSVMPKGMQSNKELTINKIKITSTTDGKNLGAWVITPMEGNAPRPAILFLHGGAYVADSGEVSAYDASTFAEEGDIVVVNVTYRLASLATSTIRKVSHKISD